ncbi:MAG TPA: carbon storage regulator [Clostridiales bacterium]|nr:carbon storage regulator [Clostridiales bacterium]
MLVISRRIGESFVIGENIEATVVDIVGEKVVLGITAPREIPITRIEVSQTAEQNLAAAASNINLHGFARLYKKRFPGERKDN